MENDRLFKVVYSGNVRKRLKAMSIVADNPKAMLASLVAIDHRLQQDPDVFGEPLFSLPGISLDIRHGAINPRAAPGFHARFSIDGIIMVSLGICHAA